MNCAHGMSLVRGGLGLYFIVSALRKTTGGWLGSGEQLSRFVTQRLEEVTPLYGGFLAETVLPNADVFALLVVIGEWVAGLSLTFGFLTRLGAISGTWLVLNYMLAKGLANPDGSIDRLFALGCVVLGLTAAGLVWGMDGALGATSSSARSGRTS